MNNTVFAFILFLVCNAEIFDRNEDQMRRLDELEKVVKRIQQQNQLLEETVTIQQTEMTELKTQLANLKGENKNSYTDQSGTDFHKVQTVSKILNENELINSTDESNRHGDETNIHIMDTVIETEVYNNATSNEPGSGMKNVTIHEPDYELIANQKRYVSSQAVAFYAVFSNNEHAPSAHNTLVFDIVRTNAQGAYNQYSGIFTAPVSGFYVFTFSIQMGCHAQGSFEIVKNADVEGVAFLDIRNGCDAEQVTMTIVSELVPGDVVFVRTHATRYIRGDIFSNAEGRSSFAGWLLSV
ncbi:Hypothetical predicted protein [Mytilus galloprovincialis]|uniref:C1q domain-containing protein n=1 Tax=Mytilus galloprovincialis TaxID=29158 RepID=A0A8B6GDS3_MYTGA|nr:Hypothetical predicted protein [Mytilus galloprovincialis]